MHTQYISTKPDKYGIKFWFLVDFETKYVMNAFPYLGANSDKSSNDLQGEYVVKKLLKPYENNGHCITADNFSRHISYVSTYLKQKQRSSVRLKAISVIYHL